MIWLAAPVRVQRTPFAERALMLRTYGATRSKHRSEVSTNADRPRHEPSIEAVCRDALKKLSTPPPGPRQILSR